MIRGMARSGVGARGVRPPFGTWISGAISGRRNFPRVGKSGRAVRIHNSLETNVPIVSYNPNSMRQSTGSGRSGGHLDEEPVAPRRGRDSLKGRGTGEEYRASATLLGANRRVGRADAFGKGGLGIWLNTKS
jgi:hypothetical protein